MPRNGSGTYNLPEPAFVPQTVISSAAVNTDLLDIAQALTSSVATDGQSSMTGPLQLTMGSAVAPSLTFAGILSTGIFLQAPGQVAYSILGALAGLFKGTGHFNANGAQDSLAIGLLADFPNANPPAGWLLCGGQAVSRITYASLFGVIGTTYGVGDGSSTFNLPDCRGRATYGQDNMGGTPANRITVAGGNFDGTILGNSGGLQNHTLQSSELVPHSHVATVTDPGHIHTTNGRTTAVIGENGSSNGASTPATINKNSTGISVSNANTGGGLSHTILNPAIMMTKMIFAGTP